MTETVTMTAPNGVQVTVPAGMKRLFIAAGYREAAEPVKRAAKAKPAPAAE